MPGSFLFLPPHTQAPLSPPATVLFTLHPSPGDLTTPHGLLITYVLLTPTLDPQPTTPLQILFIHFIAPLPKISHNPFEFNTPTPELAICRMTGLPLTCPVSDGEIQALTT